MGTTTPRPTIDDELAEMTPPSMAETMAPEPTHRASSDQEASLVAVQTDDTPAARSLADALSGIQMPCDLAPLMTTDRINPRNMLFSTSGYPPEVVGRSVADELERLGFSFVPIDERALHAHRGSTALEVRVHPDKEKAAAALAGRAGSAAEDAVIVEFQLR